MHKRWIAWMLSGMLLFAGCESRNVNMENSTPEDGWSEEELSDVSLPIGEPSVEEISAELVGTYFCKSEGVQENYYPALTLYENGDCEFSANLMTKMGALYGTFTIQENMLLMTVSGKDFTGYTADDVKSLRFDITGDDTLMYRGSETDEEQVIGMTNPFDLFVRPKSEQDTSAQTDQKPQEAQTYRITVKDNESGQEGTLTTAEDWEKVEKIVSGFASRKPLSDTDDRIQRRKSNPSFQVSLQDGKNAEKSYVVFPGTPESLGKEVMVCFDRSEGQTFCSIEIFQLLSSLLETASSVS